MLNWNPSRSFLSVGELGGLVTDLVRSLFEVRFVREVTLVTGTQLVAHGARGGVPAEILVQIVGDTASAAVVTRGAMDARTIQLHSTAPCTVDLVVYGAP